MTSSSYGTRTTFGVTMVLISAASFGMLTTLASLAYGSGSNAITVAFMRSVITVVAIFIFCLIVKKSLHINRQGLQDVFWVAIGQTGMSICYLGAVQYISVSLGAILFYTYPIVVLVVEALIQRDMPGRVRAAIFVMAFAGLVLALGPSFDSMDWRGIAFGVGASASATLLFFATRRAHRSVNESAMVLWANGLGLPIILLIMPIMGNFALPDDTIGWSGILLSGAAFALAFMTYAIGLRHILPSRAAMYFNLEPVVSVIAAAILLGEMLTPIQGTGALLVLAALMLSAWRERLGHTA